MVLLAILIFLPAGMITLQLVLDLDALLGIWGYSLYKFFFIVPPLIYCRRSGVGILRDIFKLRHWRRCLWPALGLGGLAIVLFAGVYGLLGDRLVDKALIAAKIGEQFSVGAATVFLIAPVTIFANSLLEEFFYRGFAFGLLVKKNRRLGYLLPAVAFTGQHLLFIYHWLTPFPLALAVAGLFLLALVLQRIYEQADSLVAPWIIHVLGDVAMMGIAVTLLR
ncbi:MAG: CPBP family intramembrane metalloprotease [Acidobacteria bacterium]|nr:CPBP family intramembrane metalloprotease [Acidobacteriota bacterium]